MNTVTLTRRGVSPKQSLCGIAPGWELVFNVKGLPFSEPVFANLQEKQVSNDAHGVTHLISHEDFIKIIKSEGGGFGKDGYRIVDLSVNTYSGTILKAKTLIATGKAVTNQIHLHHPSPRYLNVLIEGAKQAGIHENYVNFLQKQPTLNFSKLKMDSIWLWLFSIIFFAFFKPLVMVHIHGIMISTKHSWKYSQLVLQLLHNSLHYFTVISWFISDLFLSKYS